MMKKSFNKYTVISCIFSWLILSSCDDVPTGVGTSILPEEDLITIYTDTFHMDAYTVRQDSIFSKTSDYLLGEMYDPVYGNIKADFLCQFYCEEGFEFYYTPHNGKIDSMDLIIFYPYDIYNNVIINSVTAYGDTMIPMQVSVFPVIKSLQRNFYSNDNPEDYCDMSKPLGVATYTAFDMSIPDSVRYLKDEYGYLPTPKIIVRLPIELGQKFYDESINNPSTFKSQNAFNEFFPGLYITNTFGSGCIIRSTTPNISMRIYYSRDIKDSNGADSLGFWLQEFTVSKEVVQINRFKNDNIDKLLEKNSTHSHIKSPAGVCTKLVIPATEIAKKLDVNERYINGFNLELKYLPADDWDFAYAPPSHLLLLPEDSVKLFFESGSIENRTTSFLSYYLSPNSPYDIGYNPSTRTYSFGNISSLLKTHLENSPDKDLNLLAIPVRRDYTRYTSGSSTQFYTTGISNSFNISGVKIRTEEEYMKVVVLSSKFENKE